MPPFALVWSIVLALSAALLGCAAQPKSAPEASATASADTLATLERTPCFGTCPSYTLAVLEDGTVRYQGRQFVAREGYAEKEISPEQVEQLVEAFREAGYFDLENSYVSGAECGQTVMSDMPTAITSLRADGKSKRVRHYHGCTGFPAEERLTALENAIDEIAGTRAWVEGEDAGENDEGL